MKTKNKKNYIYVIIFVIIIIITIGIFSKKYILKKENNIIEKNIETSFVSTQNTTEGKNEEEISNTTQSENSDTETEKIETTYKGYSVIAKLEIPKINLETYVISEYSEQALGVSVTKFYGGNPNEVGNFCIAGHNYITKNMFHDIKKLSNDDIILLTDLEGNKVEYKVYEMKTVSPSETDCLSQKTDGKVELTLITCTTDSSKRIIVKAVKV